MSVPMALARQMDRAHTFLARLPLAVLLAIKLRNQCSAVIRHALSDGKQAERNGEHLLLMTVGHRICRFVDVGGHVGNWSAWCLKVAKGSAEGCVFEPSPSSLERRLQLGGSDPFTDCGWYLGANRVQTIFDVGAKSGCAVVPLVRFCLLPRTFCYSLS